MRQPVVLFLLLCLVLAGCAGREPTSLEATVAVPTRYVNDRAEPFDTPSLSPWWEMFDDPRLDDLMRRLFAGNLDLERSLARLRQAQAGFAVARAGQWPSATLNGEAARSRSPGGFVGDSYQGTLAVGYEVDLWRKFASRSEAAAAEVAASAADVQALYLSLSAQLADFYYLVVEQYAQRELILNSIAAFRDTLERVERRYRAGLVEAVDVYQARQNLRATEARLPAIEVQLRTAQHAMDVLLGEYPGQQELGVVEDLAEDPAQFPAGLPASLLARRPDVQAAFARVRAADAGVAAAIAERLPAISLLGSAGRARTETVAGLLSGSLWSLAADLSLPVLDGGRRRAEVDRRQALLEENLAAYRQTVLNAFREVENGLVANRTTEERIALLAEQTAAAESSLRLALDRYLQGVTDYLPVLVAQANQLESQSRLISARRQLISDRIALAKALGGRWMDTQLTRRLAAEQEETDE